MASGIAFETTTSLGFDEAVAHCRRALQEEGFGVLTEIDVKATMQKKLGLDVPPYLILGACNPPFAHQALSEVPAVGVLLPCNVTVSVEDDKTVVRAMKPEQVLGLIEAPGLASVAKEVGAALERVVASLPS